MKNRLSIAKDLLRKDGAIFVQIDYKEVSYLNILMDEIFGRENFVQLISVKTASPAGFKTVNPGPIDVTEYNTQNQRYIQAFLDFSHGTMTFSSTKLSFGDGFFMLFGKVLSFYSWLLSRLTERNSLMVKSEA